MKKGLRHIFPVLLLLAALLSAASCVGVNNLRKMNLRSGKIVNVQFPPIGSRALAVSVLLDIENPAGFVRMSDISGVIRSKDLVLGTFTADDFSIDAHCDKEYLFQMNLTPDEGMFFKALALAQDFSPDDYVFDIDLRLSGSPSAKGARYQLKDQPLCALLKNIQ